jgi:CheY-like chemotaxis protein
MKTILLVDDDPAIARMVKLILVSTAAYRVFTETIAPRAVQTAKQCRPDLILLDIMMPDMDGGEVAAALRKDVDLMHIKVVFVTALLGKGEETISGKHRVFPKPLNKQQLVTIVEQALSPPAPWTEMKSLGGHGYQSAKRSLFGDSCT